MSDCIKLTTTTPKGHAILMAELDRFNALNPWATADRRLVGEGVVGLLRPARSVQFALWDHEVNGATL